MSSRGPDKRSLRKGYVSNEPLREAFEKSNLSALALAERMGYFRSKAGQKRCGDDQAVRRALGLRVCKANGHSTKRARQRFMFYETALRYCEALGLDPHEVDL